MAPSLIDHYLKPPERHYINDKLSDDPPDNLKHQVGINTRGQIVKHHTEAARRMLQAMGRPRLDNIEETEKREAADHTAPTNRVKKHRGDHAENFIEDNVRTVVFGESFLGAAGDDAADYKSNAEHHQKGGRGALPQRSEKEASHYQADNSSRSPRSQRDISRIGSGGYKNYESADHEVRRR
jgi:hypothetical protein